MTNSSHIIGVYHKDCLDGTTAAAVLLKRFPRTQLFPFKHHYDESDIQTVARKGNKKTTVYIMDFSFRDNTHFQTILEKVENVVVIDHHIGVHDRLKELAAAHPHFSYVFDNTKSGASLTWKYFYKNKATPMLIELVQDADIGTWKFGKKTELSGWYLIPFMNKPEKITRLFSKPIKIILTKGKNIDEFAHFLMETFVEHCEPIFLKIGKHTVMSFNLTYNIERLRSMVGKRLYEKFNQTVALFRITGNKVNFSFRSNNTHTPSSLDLAQIFKGNGHRNAAGASVPLKDFVKLIIH